jgi:hypothetical protein
MIKAPRLLACGAIVAGTLTAPATIAPTATAAPAAATTTGAASPSTCDPTQTPAHYRNKVPSPRDVLGFGLGERETTAAQSDRYLETVGRTSDRVVTGTLATTAQGRPLKYAIVGRPEILQSLPRVRREAAVLRDPRTPAAVAKLLAKAGTPILWVSANVHGNEPSGTDAALRTLRDLGDRDDCAANRILSNALVVILPIQNPDGRQADTRQNAYGFDMNRDWFARTQPETDGKLGMLNRYPPVLYIDAHEQGGTKYFFPPNADPIYHETAEQSIGWINDLYGAPMAAEFNRRGIPFTNRDTYDLFYQGYGDTVPITAFHAAGMTFEKGGASPYPEKTEQQYLTQWVSLSSAADHREQILTQLHQMSVEAYQQGREGKLEPNQVYNPPNKVITQVPDRLVRNYFLSDAKPEVRTIVRRLQRMGVSVSRLTRPLTVPDFKAYGRPQRRTTLPAGTYWVSMAQGQKHWVQAMLGEDSYTPFPYFYDVTAWSQPLLENVSGGSSGAVLRPRAAPVPVLAAPGAPKATRTPKLGVLQLSATSGTARESTGWLRSRLDREWHLPFTLLSPADVTAGRLSGLDTLLVPDGPAPAAYDALGADGRTALQKWVNDGGRYVGWTGGTRLAARLGLTTAVLRDAKSDVPGSLFRVDVSGKSPLAQGVGATAWQFYISDTVMTEQDPARVAVSYPAATSPDWFVSGYQRGGEELGGTAAVVDEPIGKGRTVVFGGEPNFRAFSDGTAKLLFNAMTGPNPVAKVSPEARTPATQAAAKLTALESPIRVTVHSTDAPRTAGVLRSLGARWVEQQAGGLTLYAIDNPQALSADQHPWSGRLPQLLRGAGVAPVTVIIP